MAVIKCKMCGGDMELSPDMTCGKCEYCGSVMTLPKVDGEQTAAAFNRGNDFRRIGEFDKALAVYERIVEDDDSNAEAHWCCALCRFGIEYVEDPETHEYIPTCHRASFDSILNDVDYLAALKHADAVAKEQYRRDGEKIAEVQKGVLAVSQKEEPFDVFLCYKESEEDGSRTKESVRAQELYYELTEQGRRVFFARVTLEDKGGTEYEPYIFAALHSAKVMIVIGSSAAHLNAVWVKNEWSRFLKLMKQDKKKLLIPCYLDMDPYDMPEQLSILQSYDMGKIGFMQDLTRGINKVLDGGKEKEAEQKKEPQGETGNFSALVQRGNIALEDGEWERADEFFEQALNLDADEPHAYIGKFLAQQKEATLERLVKKRETGLSPEPGRIEDACPEDRDAIEEAVSQYVIPKYFSREKVYGFFTFNRNYRVKAERWDAVYEQEAAFWEGNKLFQRALEFSQGDYREELQQAHDRPLDAIRRQQEEDRQTDEAERAKVEKAYREHTEAAKEQVRKYYEDMAAAREKDYRDACEKQETVKTSDELEQALAIFQRLTTYQDSKARAEACEERLFALRQAAEELIRQEEKRKRKKKKLITVIAAVITILAIVGGICWESYRTKVIIPKENYEAAIKQMESGKYREAYLSFQALGPYKDSVQQMKNIVSLLQVSLRDTKKMATAQEQCFGVSRDGTVLTAGRNVLSSVWGWSNITSISVSCASSTFALGLKEDGTVVATGNNEDGQCNITNWSDIVDIAAGLNHSIGLKSDGTVIATGRNRFDQCDVKGWKDVVAVAAGDSFTAGLKSDGTVIIQGHKKDGKLDEVSDWTDIVAISCESDGILGLRADGTAVYAGEHAMGNVKYWENVIAISAGSNFSAALTADGKILLAGTFNDRLNKPIIHPSAIQEYAESISEISVSFRYLIVQSKDGSYGGWGNTDYFDGIFEWSE